MQIEVTSPAVTERSGTKNGKDWSIRTQTAYAFIPDETGKPKQYPESINIDLKKDQQPFAPGRYLLADASFHVGDYGKLSIGRLVLVPASPQQRAGA